jgi:hypothetical protein
LAKNARNAFLWASVGGSGELRLMDRDTVLVSPVVGANVGTGVGSVVGKGVGVVVGSGVGGNVGRPVGAALGSNVGS